jgi:outer membrane protein TolC
MRKACFLILSFLLFGPALLATNSHPALSLEQCIAIALKRNPDIAAAQALVAAAKANMKVAHAGYLPQVDIGQSYIRQTYNYTANPGTPPAVWRLFYKGQSNANAPYYYAGLNLSQNLLDFGRTKGAIESSQAQFQAAQHNLRFVRDQVDYNVRTAYFTVIAARETVEIQKAAVADAQRHLDQAQAFHQYGTAPKIDVTREQLALANARLALRQAEENLEVDRAELATTMGLPADQSPEPLGTLGQERAPESFSQLVAEAEQNRGDLLAQFDQVQAALGNLTTAKGNLKPDLSLSAFLDFRNLTLPLVYNWSLGQLLTQSIFSGGANRARVRAAQAQEAAARDNVESLRLQVEQQVFSALSNLKLAQEQIGNAIEADRYARENLALAEGRYKVGVGNVVELDDAQFQATNAAIAVVTARYNYQIASAKLDFVLGRGPR